MGQHSDPGGYPCHDNAVVILKHYQNKAIKGNRPHANKCADGAAVQRYWQWRTEWMRECLRHMRPWGKENSPSDNLTRTVADLEAKPYDTSAFLGF